MKGYEMLPICNAALEPGYGFVSDLSLTKDEIRSLELQGFIKNAVSAQGDTWKLTKKGRDTRDFFLKPEKRSVATRVADWFCYNVLRMRVRI